MGKSYKKTYGKAERHHDGDESAYLDYTQSPKKHHRRDVVDPMPLSRHALFNVIAQNDRQGFHLSLAVEEFFEALGLPEPEKGEYRTARSNGYILFLDDFGIIIRISDDKKTPRYVHNLILQPLASRTIDGFRIDIMPGLKTPVTSKEVYALEDELSEDNLQFWDSHPYNCGYMPSGTVVCFDEDAVKALPGFTAQVIKEQNKVFAPLKKAFTRAWPAGENVDSYEMARFWQMCRTMKDKNILTSGWQDEEAHKVVTEFMDSDGSRHYAARFKPF